DGKKYHHILNPHTGYSYENELDSVTIISDVSVDGDGLSTTCFALGLEKGLELIDSMDSVWAMFIDKEGNIIYSDGFLENINCKEY
ncbi:MAG: FAD:protein FMN transferase, partial [Lachnospiraceae bacterium]|nr:FAD:protein FMN transferase [Lachnospiraceae bacterium]